VAVRPIGRGLEKKRKGSARALSSEGPGSWNVAARRGGVRPEDGSYRSSKDNIVTR